MLPITLENDILDSNILQSTPVNQWSYCDQERDVLSVLFFRDDSFAFLEIGESNVVHAIAVIRRHSMSK